MILSNLHSHTDYCDGKGNVRDYVKEAIKKGFVSYGISSHNPVNEQVAWTMKTEDFDTYLNDIELAKREFGNKIELYAGLEIDYFSDTEKPEALIDKLDYWIGSIHFIDRLPDGRPWEIDGSTGLFKEGLEKIYGGNIKAAIKRYFDLTIEMIEKWKPPILGHLDKIKIHNHKEFFFDENEKWYQDKIDEVLLSAKRNKTIIEINTRGIYKGITDQPYPSWNVIEMILEKGIPLMLNSDSHHIREIDSEFDAVLQNLKKFGLEKLHVLKDHKMVASPID